MLFDKGDPREAYAIAEDAEQEKALRAKGFRPLDESGLHPDQFRAEAESVVSTETHPAPTEAPVKRGPGRPRKE